MVGILINVKRSKSDETKMNHCMGIGLMPMAVIISPMLRSFIERNERAQILRKKQRNHFCRSLLYTDTATQSITHQVFSISLGALCSWRASGRSLKIPDSWFANLAIILEQEVHKSARTQRWKLNSIIHINREQTAIIIHRLRDAGSIYNYHARISILSWLAIRGLFLRLLAMMAHRERKYTQSASQTSMRRSGQIVMAKCFT